MSVAVFDLDGTLVASLEDLVASLNAVLESEGCVPVEPSSMRGHVGFGARVLIQKGLEANGRPWTAPDIEARLPRFLDHYERTFTTHTRPFEGALAALDRLRSNGWRLAICTNKSTRLTLPLLEELDLRDLFDAVVAGDTFENAKPHGEPVLGAIQLAGGTVQGSVMIGDTRTDIDAARAAGIPAIAVTFGYSPVPVAELGADGVIGHFDQLDAALSGLSSP
ncbi:phosphoglycolate phosphatase, bacterial [Roseibium aquae]|uniref:Phosphoglycolate phosphatase n=1 Tax=Roseibium aquae TaxID=1323746 RepID=A0A916TFV5_9HYPH|nr:HAD-IA family hydrolase [Roseibium aquae]GGB42473.1 phosphoglycolate phosphatase, bacterial [Roseibium aquae]